LLDPDELADGFITGKSQAQLAQELGITQQQVSEDLRKLDHLGQVVVDRGDFHKAREVARINVKRTAPHLLAARLPPTTKGKIR
jgi:biotin operon repressor